MLIFTQIKIIRRMSRRAMTAMRMHPQTWEMSE